MNTQAKISYAGPRSRIVAAFLDLLLILAIVLLLDGYLFGGERPIALSVFLGGAAAGTCLYLVLFWSFLQATPGMLLAGVRLVSEQKHDRASLARSLLRLITLMLAVLPMCLGLILVIYDRRHQGLHDKMAGTLVVDDDESAKPLSMLLRELT